jgi:hypothetical protein
MFLFIASGKVINITMANIILLLCMYNIISQWRGRGTFVLDSDSGSHT